LLVEFCDVFILDILAATQGDSIEMPVSQQHLEIDYLLPPTLNTIKSIYLIMTQYVTS